MKGVAILLLCYFVTLARCANVLYTVPDFVTEDSVVGRLGASPAIASSTCLNATLLIWTAGATLHSHGSYAPYTDWTNRRTVVELSAGESFVNTTSTFTCSSSYPEASCLRVLDFAAEGDKIIAAVLVETANAVEVRTFVYADTGWTEGAVLPAGELELVHGVTLVSDGDGHWLLAWISNRTVHYTVSADGLNWRSIATADFEKVIQISVVPIDSLAWALGYISRLQNNYIGMTLAELRVGKLDIWAGPYSSAVPELLKSYSSVSHLGPFGLSYAAGVYTYVTAVGETEYRTYNTSWARASGILWGQSAAITTAGTFSLQPLSSASYRARWWTDTADTWAESYLLPPTESPGMNILASAAIDANGYALIVATKESSPRTIYLSLIENLPDSGLSCDVSVSEGIDGYCFLGDCSVDAGDVAVILPNETVIVDDILVRTGGVLEVGGKLTATSLVLSENSTLRTGQYTLNVTGCVELNGTIETSRIRNRTVLISYGCIVGGERKETARNDNGCVEYTYSSLQLVAAPTNCEKRVKEDDYIVYIVAGACATGALLAAAVVMFFFRHRVFKFRQRQKAVAG